VKRGRVKLKGKKKFRAFLWTFYQFQEEKERGGTSGESPLHHRLSDFVLMCALR